MRYMARSHDTDGLAESLIEHVGRDFILSPTNPDGYVSVTFNGRVVVGMIERALEGTGWTLEETSFRGNSATFCVRRISKTQGTDRLPDDSNDPGRRTERGRFR